MIDEAEVKRIAARREVSVEITEKDFALNWVLYAISQSPFLRDSLVFKGGTCLSKVYFPDSWRLSEDLDFSVSKKGLPSSADFEGELNKALDLANSKGAPGLRVDDVFDNGSFVRARLKYSRVGRESSPDTRSAIIKIEVSRTEQVIYAPELKDIKPVFSEPGVFRVFCYPLPELFAEKLRALMQRSYARDYYDVWRLTQIDPVKTGFNDHDDHLMKTVFEKCDWNKIPFEPEMILDERRVNEARKAWKDELGRLVAADHLPDFETVIMDLSEYFPKIRALADFKEDPSLEHTQTMVYLGSENLYLVGRAVELLQPSLLSKKPQIVAKALDAALELIEVDKRIPILMRERYGSVLEKIRNNPETITKKKAHRVLENIENKRRGP